MAQQDPTRWKSLAVLSTAYLMIVLDVSIVNVALPLIQKDLAFSPENLQWVISGYALTFGGFLLLGGRIGDMLGRKRVFIVGLTLFSLFSLICGLSVTEWMLITARILQGAMAAIIAPLVFSITTVAFQEGAERNKALGILGAVAAAGSAIGVLAGGILTQYAGWQWIFYVNGLIGAATIVFTIRYVHESRTQSGEHRFDLAGAVTVTAGLMLLVYALTEAPGRGWGSATTIGLLVGAAALMAVFLTVESKVHSPLVRLGFFRKRTPTAANIVSFGLGTTVFSVFFVLSLYMQQVLHMGALETGLGFLAAALVAVAGSAVAQALVTKFGPKPVLTAGLVANAAGLIYLTQISANGSYFADLFPGLVLFGIGMGLSYVPISIAAFTGIDWQDSGLASGLLTTTQQIGGALGVAILATVFATRTAHLIADGVAAPSALTAGFSLALWVAVIFAAISILATLIALRQADFRHTSEQW